MPKKLYSISIKHSPDELFDLVADIESYPEFLPWVNAARILERKDNFIIAELMIKYNIFRSKYTSKVRLIPKKEIIVELVDGPFKYLHNHWKFKDGKVSFMLDFELKSKLLESMITQEFDHYNNKMMDAFLKRAEEVL
jgi:coenzyme Q-binding protein COQ10